MSDYTILIDPPIPTLKQVRFLIQFFLWCQRKLSDKYNPKLQRYLIRKGSINYLKPCDVYLYETSLVPIKKFGIAWDHVSRAEGSGLPNRYCKCLATYTLPTRADALLIESYLKKYLHRPKITKQIIDELGNSDELTYSDEKHFKKVIEDGIKLLSQEGANELLEAILPALPEIDPKIAFWKTFTKNLRNGDGLVLWDSPDYADRGKIIFSNLPEHNFDIGLKSNLTVICRALRGVVTTKARKKKRIFLLKPDQLDLIVNWNMLEISIKEDLLRKEINLEHERFATSDFSHSRIPWEDSNGSPLMCHDQVIWEEMMKCPIMALHSQNNLEGDVFEDKKCERCQATFSVIRSS